VCALVGGFFVYDTTRGPSRRPGPGPGPIAVGVGARPVGPTVLSLPDASGFARAARPGEVATAASTEYKPRYVPGQLLVKFTPGATSQKASAALAHAGATVNENVGQIGVRVVGVPSAETSAAAASLAASPAVDYVERDVAVGEFGTRQPAPNDPFWPNQWGPLAVSAQKAWSTTQGSPSVVVAVLDTGIDFRQPDLRGATVQGYDVVNDDADPSDDQGHGTATAGVLAARTNNGRGVAGICGRCSIMPVKVLDSTGSGTTAGLAAGIIWAADHGARVISMSLGAPSSTQTLADAVAYADAKGIVLVASAGNSGSANPSYPAAYPQVISVAGTSPSSALYSWSNYGSWVQVAAPGCNAAPWLNNSYVNYCGTSSAAPVVAGIVALALSAKPNASKAELVQAITSGAIHGPDGVQYGIVNAQRTLAALGVRPAPQSSSPTR
jgi:subtilisin family serine protease